MNRSPNIVFILTDDQQRASIGALGNREIRTPNIDRLVAGGTVFTNAAIMGGTCGAVCMPSRAMLMTGRTLFHLDGLGRNIPAAHKTLPETLRAAGYHTCHVGKWHQDRASFQRSYDDAARIFGFTPGWYKDYGGHWNVAVHDFDPTGAYPEAAGYILAEDGAARLPVSPGVGGVHSTDMFGDAAVDMIRRHHAAGLAQPLFLYLSFVAPHDPRQSPNRWLEAYPPADLSVPESILPRHPFDNGELLVRDECLEAWPRQPEAIRRHIADYYAMIAHVDEQVGRVAQTLRDTGEYNNTIFVFASDNGLALGQHGLMGKQSVYEHSVGVPLILAGPGIPRGERCDTLCYLLDVFPTLCDLADVPVPASVEGSSLAPALRDRQYRVRDTLFHAYRHVQRAVRDDRFKLIEYNVRGVRTTQLFDLQSDPIERHNLANEPAHDDTLARLRDALRNWRRRLDDHGRDLADPARAAECFWDTPEETP